MARVAANQEKSVEARKQFVYHQEELIAMRKSNGAVDCEQKRQYSVAPGAKGVSRRVLVSEKLPRACMANFDMEGAESGTAEKPGDGIPRDLFPLRAKEQPQYDYKLEGVETYKGRAAYRVSFRPNHRRDEDGDEGYWKGEALIDAEEFQPVQVVTDLTAKVPMAVRVLLGTNVHGVGFSVSYQRIAPGVWFPAGFGGEFRFNALFFFRRSISINVKNSDFERADVNSSVTYGKVQ